MIKKTTWYLFAFLTILIGLYPILYAFISNKFGLLSSKSEGLLASNWYLPFFYCHIIFGGLALLTGWSQFNAQFRRKRLGWHRFLGKIYLVSVFFSGVAAVIISFWATGGWVSATGFFSLGVIWLASSGLAYQTVRQGQISAHQNWMTISFAACFAAVTLRIWLPLLIGGFGLKFMTAYPIIAWLCWVPNLLFALWWIRKKEAIQ